MNKMTLEDIKEVKECSTQKEVNDLLGRGNWKLIDVKIEKVKMPAGKVQVGEDFTPNGFFSDGLRSDKFEIQYEEKLAVLYVLGRYN